MSRQHNLIKAQIVRSVGPRSAGIAVPSAGVLHNLHTGCVFIFGSSALWQRTVVTREDETVAPFPELDCPAKRCTLSVESCSGLPGMTYHLTTCDTRRGNPATTTRSDCDRADMPGQPIFRSLFFKRDWLLRRAIRCGGGSGSRTDRQPSASHCGVNSHSNNLDLLVVNLFPTSGRSATSRPAAGLRPLRSLGVPFAVLAANESFVFWHRFKVARTPERCLCTVPEAGFAPAATPAPLIRMDGVPIESGTYLFFDPHRAILYSSSTSKPYDWF